MWLNLLSLLPSTVLAVLLIGVAFLRFYDQTDFELLGIIAHPRVWSNRLTVAALLATLANLGVEWNRRNRETDRQNEAEQRQTEEEQRRIEAREREARRDEREARRTGIENRYRLALARYQLDTSPVHRQQLSNILALLEEYGEVF